jgi:hypothetical protein
MARRAYAVSLLLVAAAAGSAAPAGAASFTPPNPVVGDTVTVTGGGGECFSGTGDTAQYVGRFELRQPNGTYSTVSSGPAHYVLNVGYQYSAAVSQAGDYRGGVEFSCIPAAGGNPYHVSYDSTTWSVGAGLGGSITVSPDPPTVNQAAALNAVPTGGNPGYTFTWDLNNDGTFGDATQHNTPYTFTTTGPHDVKVRITDTGLGGNPAHTKTITRTINVSAVTGPPPPPPPPCVKTVAFKLSQFKTPGCFTQTASQTATTPDRWETTSAITLNGIALPDFGQTFQIAGPTPGEPGGHLTAPNSTMKLDTLTIFSGNIDWSLPDGGAGQEVTIPGRTFTIAAGATMLGLKLRGSVSIKLGLDADGKTFYADVPVNIELPASFKAGPDPQFGSVTGAASVRIDDGGVHYNGLRLKADNVWLGRLKVRSVCFSYIPAGGVSTTPCDPPSFGDDPTLLGKPGGDAPFITCNTDPTTNRWDASAQIQVPTGLQLGAFGGMADGQISKLGANIANLERRVPIGQGVYLDHVAFGLCLSPPPFKIRANAGVNFLGSKNLLAVDGGFTYTDGFGFNPWSFSVDGSVKVGTVPIGSGSLGFNGNGQVDFGLKAGVDVLSGAASLSAEVSGWIDPPRGTWVVNGSGRGCLGDACATASGTLSSVGLAGCISVGTSLPTYDLVIPLDGRAPYLDNRTHTLTAGFGYVWGASSADFLGGSCNFAPYQPTRVFTARVAAGARALGFRVTPGTKAVSLRIHGSDGPPKVVLRGPRGVSITSPVSKNAMLRKGRYLLAENKTDGTTNVMLVKPAVGTWTVSRVTGSKSTPTRIDRASVQAPPTVGARVFGKGAKRTVKVAYSVPDGSKVTLVERAMGLNHILTNALKGRRCPGLPRVRPGTGQKILCATLSFRLAPGRGGTRHVQAVVTQRGIPLLQKSVASFRAPKPQLPSRVSLIRAKRSKGGIVVLFSPSVGASRYAASAKLSDGRELAFDLAGRCRALRIPNVPSGVSAAINVAGVRYDLAVGRARAVALKVNVSSAGSKSKKLRLGKVCT